MVDVSSVTEAFTHVISNGGRTAPSWHRHHAAVEALTFRPDNETRLSCNELAAETSKQQTNK